MDWLYSAHVLWFLAGAVFLLAEMALPGFVLLFFALGAFAAALAAYASLGTNGQFLVFLAVSLAGVALLRRMFLRVFQGRTHSRGEAAVDPALGDTDAGKTALVTQDIRAGAAGEIKFRGSFWRAESSVDIAAGQTVVLLGLAPNDSGAYLVRPAKEA
ncbi:MAG: NfeD family protein [Proteobacteria bacterium]|nr:NfeD family protein [Pseudomonadota bacterium]MBU1595967.1 NfeD family protein [Pseudomonadota bacterium]